MKLGNLIGGFITILVGSTILGSLVAGVNESISKDLQLPPKNPKEFAESIQPIKPHFNSTE